MSMSTSFGCVIIQLMVSVLPEGRDHALVGLSGAWQDRRCLNLIAFAVSVNEGKGREGGMWFRAHGTC